MSSVEGRSEPAVHQRTVALLSGTVRLPPSRISSGGSPRVRSSSIYAGRSGGGEDWISSTSAPPPAPKELWRIAEAGRVGGFEARPREYGRRVTHFLEAALLGPG